MESKNDYVSVKITDLAKVLRFADENLVWPNKIWISRSRLYKDSGIKEEG